MALQQLTSPLGKLDTDAVVFSNSSAGSNPSSCGYVVMNSVQNRLVLTHRVQIILW